MEGASLNASLIWQEVLPAFGIDEFTAHLPKLSIAGAELKRIISGLSAPGTDIPRMTATLGDFSFNPAIRKQEIGIPVEESMKYEKLLSLELFWGQQLGNKILSHTLEYEAARAIFNPNNFGSATNAVVAYTRANLASIQFIDDIMDGIERVRDKGEQPNTVIIPGRVYQRARRAKSTTDYVVGSLGAGSIVTANTIQQALAEEGIEKVLIGRAAYNSAEKGAVNLTRIWSDDYIWIGRSGYENKVSDEGLPIIDGVGGMAFWKPYGLMSGETYRDETTEQQIVRGKTSGNPTIFNANAGTLIATQYS